MKLTAFFMIGAFLQIHASGFSQKVTISEKNVPIVQVFRTIENQTEYLFWYKTSLLKQAKNVSLEFENATLEEVLKQCFEGQPFSYSIKGKMIVLTPNLEKKLSRVEALVPPPINITGVVTDEENLPLSGVSVVIKGKQVGTVTDSKGEYALKNVSDEGELNFSIIGYTTQTIAVKGRTKLNVVMKLDASLQMDEAVVIGYGTVKKKDLTGSVVRIGQKQIEQSSFVEIGQILQGQVSGMEVISGNGRPGDQVRIRIRGESTLQGDASPLIVIDEIPMPDGYDLNLINPQDITSIDILKGASAAAIYGAKANGGVVLISTKQGRDGIPEITYNGNVNIKGAVNKIESLKSDDYKALVGRSVVYNYESTREQFPSRYYDIRTMSEFNMLAVPGYFGEAESDWVSALSQTPISATHNLSVRGGSKQAFYYGSFGYVKNEGRIINNSSDRLTGSLRLDFRPKKYFEMGFNLNATSNPQQRSLFGGDWGSGDGLKVAYTIRPDIPIYDTDGSYYRYYSTGHSRYLDNPLQMAKEVPQNIKNTQYTASAYGRIIFNENIRFQTTYSYTKGNNSSSTYFPSYTYSGSGGYYQDMNGLLRTSSGYSEVVNIDNTLSYTKTTARHDLSALVGTTFNEDKSGIMNQEYQDFPDDLIQNTTYNAAKWNSSSGSDEGSAYFSIYGRVNYKFDDKYLITATLRRDASSKFSRAHRAGMFPSIAVAWVLSEEAFLNKVNSPLSFLKLRAGIGRTGGNSIGRYSWRTLFENAEYFGLAGTRSKQIGNEQVKWEQADQIDLGLDFGFFQNRISGTIGYYTKNVKGLLYDYSLAPSAGLTKIFLNVAEIRNHGIEFDIKGQIIETSDWSLGASFNLSSNTGKIIGLDQPTIVNNNILKVGQPIGLLYGYKAVKIIQNEAERLAIIAKGLATSATVGRYYYENQDELPALSALYDRVVVGTAVPDYYGGLSVDFRYKRLSTRLTGKYSRGGQKSWTALKDNFHSNLYNPSNVLVAALYSWTPDLPNSRFQRFGSSWENFSSNYVFDASYLKFTDIYISYELPLKWIEKVGMRSAQVYGAVNNIMTFTNYPGTNVEAFSGGILAGTSEDYSIYPPERGYTFGLKLMLR